MKRILALVATIVPGAHSAPALDGPTPVRTLGPAGLEIDFQKNNTLKVTGTLPGSPPSPASPSAAPSAPSSPLIPLWHPQSLTAPADCRNQPFWKSNPNLVRIRNNRPLVSVMPTPTSKKISMNQAILTAALAAVFHSTLQAAPIPLALPRPDGRPGDSSKPVKVHILAGQSNMVGMGDITGAQPPPSVHSA